MDDFKNCMNEFFHAVLGRRDSHEKLTSIAYLKIN